jgi:ABC-type polysaccharide transport system permease subunit
MIKLCAPAIIYLIFSITQIIIDVLKKEYNTAFMKVIVTIMVTLLLNILCQRNLTVVSWLIVLIPFMLMTVIVSMLLFIFGLNATTGKINGSSSNGINKDASGNIIIYDPQYNITNPVYYKSPNLIIPNPNLV